MDPQNNPPANNNGNSSQNIYTGVASSQNVAQQLAAQSTNYYRKSFQTFRNISIVVALICLLIRILLSVFYVQIMTFIFSSNMNIITLMFANGLLSILLAVPTTVLFIITLVKYVRYKSTLSDHSRNYREAFLVSRRITILLLVPTVLVYAFTLIPIGVTAYSIANVLIAILTYMSHILVYGTIVMTVVTIVNYTKSKPNPTVGVSWTGPNSQQ